jgi:hypothetical protein
VVKLTRRELPALLTAPAAAQQAPPSGPAQELAAARETLRGRAEELAKVKLPPGAEPAFQFKA